MSKTAFALLLAVLLAAGIFFWAAARNPESPGTPSDSAEIALLRETVKNLSERIARVEEEIRQLAGTVASLQAGLQSRSEPRPSKVDPRSSAKKDQAASGEAQSSVAEGDIPPFVLPYRESFENYIASLIEQDRKRRREEQRRQMEELRREIEEMRKGPYGRFNMKVNSLAKFLDMTDGQKDRYYEISKAYYEALQDLRKSIKWNKAEERKRYKEEQDRLQDEYNAEVERILTADQVQRYRSLPAWSRNINNLGRVTPLTRRSAVMSVEGGIQISPTQTLIFESD